MTDGVNHLIVALLHERYCDLLRAAEQHRRVRQVASAQQARRRFPDHALAWLGRRLMAWGWRLQQRYDGPASLPTLPAYYPHDMQPSNGRKT